MNTKFVLHCWLPVSHVIDWVFSGWNIVNFGKRNMAENKDLLALLSTSCMARNSDIELQFFYWKYSSKNVYSFVYYVTVALWPWVFKCQSQLLKFTNINHLRLPSIPCGVYWIYNSLPMLIRTRNWRGPIDQ